MPDNRNAKERSSCVRASEGRSQVSLPVQTTGITERLGSSNSVDPRYYDRGFELSSFFYFFFSRSACTGTGHRSGEKKCNRRDRSRNRRPPSNNIWRIPARFPTIWSDEEMPGSARNNVLFVAFHSWGSPGQGDNR